jgi:DNA polymerase III subunit delta
MIYKSYLIEQNINLLDKNLFLFYGVNLGLKNELKDKIKFQNKNAEIINLSQDDIISNIDNFFNEILNISLFDEKKIYFINQVNDKILDAIKIIEPKIDYQKIYLISEPLDKRSKIRNYFEKSNNCGAVACYNDNEISFKKIIIERLKNYKGVTAENINLISDKCNFNRDKLNNELDKIYTFFLGKNIDRHKLEILLDSKINNDFSLLKDEAFNGNKIETNKLLSDTIIDSEKNVLYLNIINQRLLKLNEIFKLIGQTSLEKAIDMLKPPIFWKDKPAFLKQAKKWNMNKIKQILNKTYNIELEIKSNSIVNKNILLKKLLIDICNLANAS